MKKPDFPKTLQFWTKVGNDQFDPHNKFPSIEKEFPHIWFDNKKGRNVIVVPNPYDFFDFERNKETRNCISKV